MNSVVMMKPEGLAKLQQQVVTILKDALPFAVVEAKADLSIWVQVPRDHFKNSFDEIISFGFSVQDDQIKEDGFCLFIGSIFDMSMTVRLEEMSN